MKSPKYLKSHFKLYKDFDKKNEDLMLLVGIYIESVWPISVNIFVTLFAVAFNKAKTNIFFL